MARYSAIACVCKSLLRSLSDFCPAAEFAGATPSFEIYQTESFNSQTGRIVTEGFTVFPWKIAPNAQLRNKPVRRETDGSRKRPSLPVDVFLLITPWATDAERQLRILGWMMRHFEDRPILDAGSLNGSLSTGEICFQPYESVELICDPLLPADWLALWDKFKHKLPASMTYVARAVQIDSEIIQIEGPAVTSRTFQASPGLEAK